MTPNELKERVRGACMNVCHEKGVPNCNHNPHTCSCDAILTLVQQVQREAAHPVCEQHNDELTFCVACAATLRREAAERQMRECDGDCVSTIFTDYCGGCGGRIVERQAAAAEGEKRTKE